MRVDITNRQKLVRVPKSRITRAVREACRAGRWSAPSLSVVMVDASEMRRINRDFLGHDYVTDVLAFPFEDGDPAGEIVVCPRFAKEQALRRRHPTVEELLLYVVHGTLHLAGFRDKKPTDVRRMRAAERKALARLGIERDLWRERS
jgi:probable rRNA maturation factor